MAPKPSIDAQIPYLKILTAQREPASEICAVGLFSNLLPQLKGSQFPESEEELIIKARVPDLKCWRNLGRAGCLALLHYEPIKEVVNSLRVDPRRIGIYTSIGTGSLNWNSILELTKTHPENFASTMRKSLPPKQIFKYGVNIPAAQLGIFLGVTGPHYSFQDWNSQTSNALSQAISDLLTQTVDLAIAIAAYSLDDPLQNMRVSESLPKGTLVSEATACVVFDRKSLDVITTAEGKMGRSPYYY